MGDLFVVASPFKRDGASAVSARDASENIRKRELSLMI
jgi:hypothetical protein